MKTIGEEDTRSRRMEADSRSVCFHNSVKMSEYDQLDGTANQALYGISIVFTIYRSIGVR